MIAGPVRFKPGYSKDSRMPGVPEAGWPTPIVTATSATRAGGKPTVIFEGPNYRKQTIRPFTYALVSWYPWMADPQGEVIRMFYGEVAAKKAETLMRFRDKKWAYDAARLQPVPIYERWPKRDRIHCKESDAAHLVVMLDGRPQTLVDSADRAEGYVVLLDRIDGKPVVEDGEAKMSKVFGKVEFYHRH